MFNRLRTWTTVLGLTLAVIALLSASVAARSVIEFWTFLDPTSGDARGVALGEVIERYENEHPDVEVKLVNVHWSNIVDRILLAHAAGSGPDVIYNNSTRVPLLVDAGAAIPLTQFFDKSTDWTSIAKSDLIVPWESQLYQDELWSVHHEMRVMSLLWYRQDLLDLVGMEVPSTWAEMADVAEAISKATDGKIWGFPNMFSRKDGAVGMQDLLALWLSGGGDFVNDDGTAAFNDEVGVAVMEIFLDMAKRGAMPTTMLSTEEVLTAVRAGRFAMALGGSHNVVGARSGPDGSHIKTAPVPSLVSDGEPAPAVVSGQSFMIGAHSKQPELAWNFIAFMIRPDNQAIFSIKANQLPTRWSTLEDPWYSTPEAEEMMDWLDYIGAAGVNAVQDSNWNLLLDSLALAFERAFYDGIPAQQALNESAEIFNSRRR